MSAICRPHTTFVSTRKRSHKGSMYASSSSTIVLWPSLLLDMRLRVLQRAVCPACSDAFPTVAAWVRMRCIFAVCHSRVFKQKCSFLCAKKHKKQKLIPKKQNSINLMWIADLNAGMHTTVNPWSFYRFGFVKLLQVFKPRWNCVRVSLDPRHWSVAVIGYGLSRSITHQPAEVYVLTPAHLDYVMPPVPALCTTTTTK